MLSRRTALSLVPAAAAASVIPAAPVRAAATTGPAPTGQSPIDIAHWRAEPVRRAPLTVEYRRTDVEFEYISRGFCDVRGSEETVEAIVPPGAGRAWVNGKAYELEQFHFHVDSEHTLGGITFPVEQHFVHRSGDGQLMVIGLWLLPSRTPQVVDQVLADLPEECGEALHIADLDLRALLPHDLTTYRYSGSLTTSPFTEGVLWNVLARPGRVSRGGIQRLEGLFPAGNSRAVQPLAGRRVVLAQAY